MNERIRELELQVAQSFDPLHRLSQQEYTTEFNKRFAELLKFIWLISVPSLPLIGRRINELQQTVFR